MDKKQINESLFRGYIEGAELIAEDFSPETKDVFLTEMIDRFNIENKTTFTFDSYKKLTERWK